MDKINSPHGIFFRTMMKKPEVARSFFQAYLQGQKPSESQKIMQAINWDNLTLLDKVTPIAGKKPLYAHITYHTFTKLFVPKADVYLHGLLHMEEEQEQDMELSTLEHSFLAHFEQSNEAILRYHQEQGHDRQPIILNCVLSNRDVLDSDEPISFS